MKGGIKMNNNLDGKQWVLIIAVVIIVTLATSAITLSITGNSIRVAQGKGVNDGLNWVGFKQGQKIWGLGDGGFEFTVREGNKDKVVATISPSGDLVFGQMNQLKNDSIYKNCYSLTGGSENNGVSVSATNPIRVNTASVVCIYPSDVVVGGGFSCNPLSWNQSMPVYASSSSQFRTQFNSGGPIYSGWQATCVGGPSQATATVYCCQGNEDVFEVDEVILEPISETAVIQSPFFLNGWIVKPNKIEFSLVNEGNSSLTLLTAEIFGCGFTPLNFKVDPKESKIVDMSCYPDLLVKGDVFMGNLSINYQTKTGNETKTAVGYIKSVVK
jgi:hypothetical protein